MSNLLHELLQRLQDDEQLSRLLQAYIKSPDSSTLIAILESQIDQSPEVTHDENSATQN